jgi:hypothetical protein
LSGNGEEVSSWGVRYPTDDFGSGGAKAMEPKSRAGRKACDRISETERGRYLRGLPGFRSIEDKEAFLDGTEECPT